MRAWLVRVLEAAFRSPPPSVRALARRLEALEEDVEALSGRHRKLAGRFNGGLRGEPAPEALGNGHAEMSDEDLNERIKRGEAIGILRKSR